MVELIVVGLDEDVVVHACVSVGGFVVAGVAREHDLHVGEFGFDRFREVGEFFFVVRPQTTVMPALDSLRAITALSVSSKPEGEMISKPPAAKKPFVKSARSLWRRSGPRFVRKIFGALPVSAVNFSEAARRFS